VDPHGGSYFVESLTSALEEKVTRYLETIEKMGGAARAIDYTQEEVHRAAYEHQLQVESGERVVVGVNRFEDPDEGPVQIPQPDYHALAEGQREKLARWKAERDAAPVRERIAALRSAAAGSENVMPAIIAAVKDGVTLGEISDAFREEWGVFQPR
jgi:methylmalonyl-CoA mutase N-terminal domain/subunit